MARYLGYKRPKDLKRTMGHLMHYLGGHKWMFLLVAVLAGFMALIVRVVKNVFEQAIILQDDADYTI